MDLCTYTVWGFSICKIVLLWVFGPLALYLALITTTFALGAVLSYISGVKYKWRIRKKQLKYHNHTRGR